MPKRSSKKNAPRGTDGDDVNEIAAEIVRIATENEKPEQSDDETQAKNPAAVALGRLGGLKGGRARADKLTAQQRSDIARQAAEKRWGKKGEQK